MSALYLLNKGTDPINWVFIHGWGSDSGLWQPLRERLSVSFPGSHYAVDLPGFGDQKNIPAVELAEYVDGLVAALPANTILVGWSLGGMLATQLAKKAPSKVGVLITLACNLCFSERADWPLAMNAQTFMTFKHNFEAQPKKTWQRFCALQSQGSDDPKVLLKRLKLQLAPDDESKSNWMQGLVWLEELDNRQVLSELTIPNLHLFGGGDALVPDVLVSEVSRVGAAEAELIEGAGHCLQLTQTEKVFQSIDQWLNMNKPFTENPSIDKLKIARSFGLAAKSYDSAARLQKEVAEALLVFGEKHGCAADLFSGNILDLGCGTGYVSTLLGESPLSAYDKNITLLDLAEPMVGEAQKKLKAKPIGLSSKGVFCGVCADAESLPFKSNHFHSIISSLSVQWCSDLSVVSGEVFRALAADGYFLFSTLGPNTLKELKQSWAAINGFVHVNQFKSVETIAAEVLSAGMVVEHMQSVDMVMKYSQLLPILRDLKSIGAHNMNEGQNPGLTSTGQLKQLGREYERYRTTAGYLPVTYEVIFVLAAKKRPYD